MAKKKTTAKKKASPKRAAKPKRVSKKAAAEAARVMRIQTPLARCPDPANIEQLTWPPEAMRLGFAVKVMGAPIKSNDTRRWQAHPHLRVSLGYLCEIFAYLRKHSIHMYRISSDLAPYVTHPDMPQFHNMIKESASDLAWIGNLAKRQDLRLSFHPSQFVILNSGNDDLTRRSIRDLEAQAEMLDLMECGPEAVLVIHVGGHYGDSASGRERWIETWKRLGEPVRRRLTLENDDIRFSAADVLQIHEHTGVRLIFDYQHFWCLNPEGLDMQDTVRRFLKTWPDGIRPKMHYSCARTDMRELKRKNRKTKRIERVLQPPVWTGHADFNNPFETIAFLRSVAHHDADIMLEAKAKDLALIRLRHDLSRFAPDLAARYGVRGSIAEEDVEEFVISGEGEEEALAASESGLLR